MIRSHVLICGGTGCTSSGSIKIREAMERELAAQGLSDEIKIVQTGCFGLCANGPIMIVYPEGTFYSHVKVDDVPEIVSEHLLKGRIVDRLVHHEGHTCHIRNNRTKESHVFIAVFIGVNNTISFYIIIHNSTYFFTISINL